MFWITIRLSRRHSSCPFLRARADPHADLDTVVDQEAQHGVDRGQLIEQVEDQLHEGLHLLVGGLDDLSVRQTDVADGNGPWLSARSTSVA
jgi:hypothetical protein